jgi:hypothetical protein
MTTVTVVGKQRRGVRWRAEGALDGFDEGDKRYHDGARDGLAEEGDGNRDSEGQLDGLDGGKLDGDSDGESLMLPKDDEGDSDRELDGDSDVELMVPRKAKKTYFSPLERVQY